MRLGRTVRSSRPIPAGRRLRCATARCDSWTKNLAVQTLYDLANRDDGHVIGSFCPFLGETRASRTREGLA